MTRTLTCTTPGGKGRLSIGDSPLGRGGEGSVWALTGSQTAGIDAASTVAKIYHKPHEGNREAKIATMVAHAPSSTSVAWPLGAIYDGTSFQGYVMQKLDSSSYRPWLELSNTADRRKSSPDFSFMYALTSSLNLCVAVRSVHAAGACVGDINESNIFVGRDASVLLIDTDSAQIVDPTSGHVFHCEVGKPEYTAAELTHGPLRDQMRTPESDLFGCAVAIYQMLTGGSHPTSGSFTGSGDPMDMTAKIRQGVYPFLNPSHAQRFGFTTNDRVPVDALSPAVVSTLLRALNPDPGRRGSLADVEHVLDDVSDHLVTCDKVATHAFDSRQKSCPWCCRLQQGLYDPWSAPPQAPSTSQQKRLKPVGFHDTSSEVQICRAPVTTPGTSSYTPPSTSYGGYSGGSSYSGYGYGGSSYGSYASPWSSGGYSSVSSPGTYGSSVSQGYGYSTPSTGSPSGTQAPAALSGPPKFGPRHRLIISYPGGSSGPRPPLRDLTWSSAWYCIRYEVPSLFRAWWVPDRRVAHPLGLILGLVYGVVMTGLWPIVFLSLYTPHIASSIGSTLFVGFLCASIINGLWWTLYLTGSAIHDRYAARKQYGSLKGVLAESVGGTVKSYLLVPFVWGPLFTAILPLILIPLGRRIYTSVS